MTRIFTNCASIILISGIALLAIIVLLLFGLEQIHKTILAQSSQQLGEDLELFISSEKSDNVYLSNSRLYLDSLLSNDFQWDKNQKIALLNKASRNGLLYNINQLSQENDNGRKRQVLLASCLCHRIQKYVRVGKIDESMKRNCEIIKASKDVTKLNYKKAANRLEEYFFEIIE